MLRAGANLAFIVATAATAVASLALAVSRPADADVLVFHGATSGQQTLDEAEGGGNPFASAFIDVLAKPSVRLSELSAAIRKLTAKRSEGLQNADVPSKVTPSHWQLVPPPPAERRIALVLVVSDYYRAAQDSLPGAKLDAVRVAAALKQAGFDTEMAIDLELATMKRKLASFSIESTRYDAALIYTTGHGVEVARTVFLLPGDFPVSTGISALATRAVSLPDIASAARAKRVNLVFYAGCRDNPWAAGDGTGRK